MTKALNASWKRNEVISSNIANVNTPNYKKASVEFESLLQSFLKTDSVAGKTTHQKHIPIGIRSLNELDYRINTQKDFMTRRDGNNVDIDVEMGELSKNIINYNTISTQMNNSFKRLRSAINEGRG